MGAILIVVSIGIAKIPDILSASSGSGVNAVPATAIILALIASCNSGKYDIWSWITLINMKLC